MTLYQPLHTPSAAARWRGVVSRSPGALLALAFLGWIVVAILTPHLLSGGDPLRIAPETAFQAPSWQHPFGTDQCGRDVYTRIVFGARQSLAEGIGAVALGIALALCLAVPGGIGGPLLRKGVERLLEIQFSFPILIFAVLFSAHLGGGIGPLIVTMGIGMSSGYAKTILARIVAVRNTPYIEAAQVLGHSPTRIIVRQILPNAFQPLLVMVTMGVGHALAWSSSLSFLGLGVSPPSPEWGTMLAMGRDFITRAWWLTLFPGLFIVLTTLATTVIGRQMQHVIEHRD